MEGKIRRIRQGKNYSQEYMAFKLNISQNAYSKIERGKTQLKVESLLKIAKILEVTAGELLQP